MIGGLLTVAHFLLLVVLVETFRTAPTHTSAAGYAIMSLVNYRLNYTFTFAAQRPHREVLPKFAAVALCGLGLNTAVMYLLHDVAGAYYLAAQGAATAVTLLWNFSANQYWSFRADWPRS